MDMEQDRYGRPRVKRRIAKFAAGGSIDPLADEPPAKSKEASPSAWSKVKQLASEAVDTVKNAPRSLVVTVGNALTPDTPIALIKKARARDAQALEDADPPNRIAADTYKRGGKIKAKPRGVGVALRGHGKAGKR